MAKVLEKSQVLANECIAPRIYRMELTAPQIAMNASAGQFVHVRVCDYATQLLRMPFCIYDVNPQFGSIEILYQVVGEGTEQLSGLNLGDRIDLIGPLGTGWTIPETAQRALLIGGGLGSAPLNLLACNLAQSNIAFDLVMGAPSAERLVGHERFLHWLEQVGGEAFVATDDGSEGLNGFCTELSAPLIASGNYDCIYVCGPEPMERKAVAPALEASLFCEVSLERLMACGVGACLSCVVETHAGRKKCCTDGPVFDAAEVIW